MKKKSVVITSVIIFSIIGIGGGATYATSVSNHKELVATAKADIGEEDKELKETSVNVKNFELEGGYLAVDLTEDNIKEVRDTLELIKDTYTDYELESNDLKKELHNLNSDKQKIENEIVRVEKKLELQDEVNSLFGSQGIEGSKVNDVVISDRLESKTLEDVEKSLESAKDTNAWYKAVEGLVNEANSQLQQIDKAQKAINSTYDDKEVKSAVTREDYNSAKSEVDKVKNKTLKKKMQDKLKLVLEKVNDNEEVAHKASVKAEEKAKSDEEARAMAEAEANARRDAELANGNCSPENTGVLCTDARTQEQSDSSSSSNSHSNSTSSKNSGSEKFSGVETNESGSSKSSSDSSSSSNSSSNSSSSDSGDSKSSAGGTSTTGKKTGEGQIKNSNSTYETGTFDGNDMDGVPWDSFSTAD